MDLVTAAVVEPGIVLVTLERPERRNALSGRMLTELHTLFDRVAAEPETRVVVVTGAGESFCAGADMKATDGDEPEPDAVPIASGRCSSGAACRPATWGRAISCRGSSVPRARPSCC
jgi:enoyl-CoA hydratase/carnithine racemase